jgi:hypothetical protein
MITEGAGEKIRLPKQTTIMKMETGLTIPAFSLHSAQGQEGIRRKDDQHIPKSI